MKIIVVALVACASLLVPSPVHATNYTCYSSQYWVIPAGPGYLDIREFGSIVNPHNGKFGGLAFAIYNEAGGDAGNLDRGDDDGAMNTPSDGGWCGLGLLPPTVDDLELLVP